MRKQFTLGLALAGCVLTFAGCSGSPQPPAGDEMMTTPDPSFIAEEDAWRARRDEGLRKPDGWTSLIGLHWIELKAHFIGSGATNGIRLAMGPEKMGMLQQEGERLFLPPPQRAAPPPAPPPAPRPPPPPPPPSPPPPPPPPPHPPPLPPPTPPPTAPPR